MNKTILCAPAKVNLFLEVENKKEDGYHEIASVMQSVSLTDTVVIELNKKQKNEVNMIDCPQKIDDNLVLRAVETYLQKAEITDQFVKVTVYKKIPICAGLGGGSADCGATLLGLNKIFARFSDEELLKMGKELGADVPFCMVQGTKVVHGIGELLSDCTALPKCYLLLVNSGKKSSTKEVYETLDRVPNRKQKSLDDFMNALDGQKLQEIGKQLYNAFEQVVPISGQLKDVFKTTKAIGYTLCGSGPSVIALYRRESKVKEASLLLDQLHIEHYITMPL